MRASILTVSSISLFDFRVGYLVQDSTKRFSDRVENYLRYRPHYPTAVLEYLSTECQLKPSSVIADIGSGTGILSEMFLKNENVVHARSGREAAESSSPFP